MLRHRGVQLQRELDRTRILKFIDHQQIKFIPKLGYINHDTKQDIVPGGPDCWRHRYTGLSH
jgi:hypothetical protein